MPIIIDENGCKAKILEHITRSLISKQPITNELIDSHALPSKIRDFLNSICQKGKNYCIYYIPINISNYKKEIPIEVPIPPL